MAKVKTTTAEERKKQFIYHLVDNGWLPNVDYIDERTGKESFDLEVLIMGKMGRDFHLISPDEKYTIRIKSNTATFWRKDPSWKKLFNAFIKQIELIDGGIRWEIMDIKLPKIVAMPQEGKDE